MIISVWYLLAANLANKEPNKQRRSNWVRYERKHSMSAGHVDWHEDERTGIKVCVIEDGASRKILVGGEYSEINTENNLRVLRQWLMNNGGFVLCGSLFSITATNLELTGFMNGSWESEFKDDLEGYGTKPILTKVTEIINIQRLASRKE